jgi:hypothetical protein
MFDDQILEAIQKVHSVRTSPLTNENVIDALDRILVTEGSLVRWHTVPDTFRALAPQVSDHLPYRWESLDLVHLGSQRIIRTSAIDLNADENGNLSLSIALAPVLEWTQVMPSEVFTSDGPLSFRNPFHLMHPFPTELTENHLSTPLVNGILSEHGLTTGLSSELPQQGPK